jgi:hypothetical protein
MFHATLPSHQRVCPLLLLLILTRLLLLLEFLCVWFRVPSRMCGSIRWWWRLRQKPQTGPDCIDL